LKEAQFIILFEFYIVLKQAHYNKFSESWSGKGSYATNCNVM